MKENYSFETTKKEIQRKNENPKDNESLELRDHILSLRYSIQKLQEATQSAGEPENEFTETDREQIKMLRELVSPESVAGFQEIAKEINQGWHVSPENPRRRFVDINDEELAAKIGDWTDNLIKEIRETKPEAFSENDFRELEAQSWLLFESMSNVCNTRAIEKDVNEFYQKKELDEFDKKQHKEAKQELLEDLRSRYPFQEDELGILIDLTRKDQGDEYNLRTLIETTARVWDNYKMGEKKGPMAKIALGYLLAKGVNSFSPSLFENLITDNKFQVGIFLEYFGLNKISDLVEAKSDIELAKLMKKMNTEINERIANSLFFQEFEFIHEKSMGELYTALEKGKGSSAKLVEEMLAKFAPNLAGIGMSLGFLGKINPILGGIGLAGLPIMYTLAKKQSNQLRTMHKQERAETENIGTALSAVKSGLEEIKISPDTKNMADDFRKGLDAKDELSLNRIRKEIGMGLKRAAPFEISMGVAAATGAAMQEMKMISGGAILATMIYSDHLNRPVQELVDLYFNDFPRYVQDIKRMEEILGEYDQLDVPGGEKEQARRPVSDLANFDITVQGLEYKKVLDGVNLEIKQGELLTITGGSGTGKSTLLRNMTGLLHPEKGAVRIGGVNLDEIKRHGPESIYSALAYCNQQPQIFEHLPLRDNLLLWSQKEISDERLKQVLADLGLNRFADKLNERISHFSGGEKIRIGLARALLKNPKIMLLDEPTAGLDSSAAGEVRKIIKNIHEQDPEKTIICVSHDERMPEISDRQVDIKDLSRR